MSREAETAGLDALQLGHLRYFDNLSPRAARELIQRLSQRLREADDRIVNDDRRSGRAHGTGKEADSQTAVESAYLAAKNPWLTRQFHAPLGLGDLPFVVGPGACCTGRAAAVAARPQAR